MWNYKQLLIKLWNSDQLQLWNSDSFIKKNVDLFDYGRSYRQQFDKRTIVEGDRKALHKNPGTARCVRGATNKCRNFVME